MGAPPREGREGLNFTSMSGAPDGQMVSDLVPQNLWSLKEEALAKNKLWSLGRKPSVHLGGPST